MPKVIVIGGGPGGLFTAAILAKEGMDVTLIEKNRNIGGGMQSFSRFGEVFDTGMHVVGGLTEGGNVRAICNYLGFGDKLPVKDVGLDITDRIHFAEEGDTYDIAGGREDFKERLSSYFPEEKEAIAAYVDAIFKICDSVDIFNLRENNSDSILFGEDFLLSANGLIKKYISDPKLQAVLSYINLFYSGVRDVTPAYIHTMLQVLYINGPTRFVGGSERFVSLLCDSIRENGGRIIAGHAVTRITTDENRIVSVTLSNGKEYSADSYVSAMDPKILIRLMDRQNVFPKSFRTRIDEVPVTYSAFSLFIKLKPKSIPYLNHTGFIFRSYDSVWQFTDNNRSWPQGMIYTTPPEGFDDRWARKIVVSSPMQWSSVERWENTGIGDRGPEYHRWKEECTERMLDFVETAIPNIRSCIDAVNSASPLTIRDYFMTSEGNMSGFLRDCNHIEKTMLPVQTKLPNLFLTGQNNNIHGFCGVALTAMLTCEAVLGSDTLVERISKYRLI